MPATAARARREPRTSAARSAIAAARAPWGRSRAPRRSTPTPTPDRAVAARGHVEGFVPFVHVRDVRRSAAFYEHFGFEVHNVFEVEGRRVWCWLERNQARLMLAEADAPVEPGAQAVLFYLYAHDLEGLHRRLTDAGREPGPIGP